MSGQNIPKAFVLIVDVFDATGTVRNTLSFQKGTETHKASLLPFLAVTVGFEFFYVITPNCIAFQAKLNDLAGFHHLNRYNPTLTTPRTPFFMRQSTPLFMALDRLL
ncbi:hypothetical protein K6M90_25385 [Rhizobium sp. 9T]|uniref:hypothetical protein n=1 Tax=Rhizobium croatiense TaxID=2867516 RepID=UPI001C931EEE|nr:hypothetical protein [Rhizobium croatiense]MBY4610982.1 hypothetical protein [Rhizobium croatiense]